MEIIRDFILAVMLMPFFLFPFTGPDLGRYYARLYQIKAINIEQARMTVEDYNGNEWNIYCDIDDWNVGDYISAIVDNNGTDNIYDDEIIGIRSERPDKYFKENGNDRIQNSIQK